MSDGEKTFYELLEKAVHGNKYSAEMWAEALREAGVLVFVFAPLYKVFEGSEATWKAVIIALIVGITFIGFGIEVERRRE
jgi:hypothetical protein